MKEKTIDLLERTLLTHALISTIHFKKPLPALQKLNAEIEQHIRELKDIPSTEDALKIEIKRLKGALEVIAYLRELNPEMKANKFSSCAEDALRNLCCTMGDIATQALGTGALQLYLKMSDPSETSDK